MATIQIPRSTFDTWDEDTRICVYCDAATLAYFCPKCNEYKGLMTIAEWESYTGEVWEA